MASDYGLNFGFRRSDETMRSGNEGRQKVPATGTFLQGDLVELDPANPGFIKKSAAGAPIEPGFRGLLIQEEGWDQSIYSAPPGDSFTRGTVRNGRLCSIWTGAGLKIWLKNTAAQTRADGRVIAARTAVTAVALAIGDLVEWDGAKFVEATGIDDAAKTARAVGRCTLSDGVGYAEIVLVK